MNGKLSGAIRAALAGACGVAVVVTLGAVPASADPSKASSDVAAGSAQARFSWRTPVERASLVRFASTVSPGAASTVMTLMSADAPNTYRFPLTLQHGESIVSDGAGGYDLVRITSGAAIGFAHLDAPWAHDRYGRTVPTSFSLDGNTVIQSVDTSGATFPLTADPHYTWGWVTGTIYFNKHETRLFTAYGTAVGLIASLGGPWAPLLRGYVAYLMTVAAKASADGKCLKVKSTLTAYEYSGGYCT